MTTSDPGAVEQCVRAWWKTKIVEMEPGEIRIRGYPIEDLIGRVSFPQMIWLMLRGELPSPAQASLLEAALVSAVDHGPQAPSIAVARMAMTCGVDLNNAMASALNVLGDIHGGAGEQAVALFSRILSDRGDGESVEAAAERALDPYFEREHRFVPGFGHRYHPTDPRAPRLLELVRDAQSSGVVSGEVADAAVAMEACIERRKGRQIPMNIDGATAVIYGELGFPAPLARGLFCVSRSIGILAHAWEQSLEGARNKGPLPRQFLWTYEGAPPRSVPAQMSDRK